MKKSRIGRILQILSALQSGDSNRVDRLAKLHKSSRRTIFRDLKELKAIGVPYHYKASQGKYSVDSGFFMPAVNLSAKEALSLLLLAYKMENLGGIPYKNEALVAAMKLQSNLPEKVRRYCNNAMNHISIKLDRKPAVDFKEGVFEQLLEAILKKQFVNISYAFPSERLGISIELRPFHMLYNFQTWYVIGYANSDNEVRSLQIYRIREVHRLNKFSYEESKFDINEYISRAWSTIPEGRLYNVKLKFSPKIARSISEVQWHSTQTVSFEPDGSAIVEFRVDGLNEIMWWILSYSGQVQVLSPNVLRQRVVEVARNMVSSNERETFISDK